jgi:hypothetical protein
MQTSTDSISIELVVAAAQMSAENIWMQGDLEININGQKISADSDIINAELLIESLQSEGEFFIFSCSCGLPECSGWIKGIQVTHMGDAIKWTDANKGRTWNLERHKMESDLATIREEVNIYKDFFRQKQIKYVGVGYNW